MVLLVIIMMIIATILLQQSIYYYTATLLLSLLVMVTITTTEHIGLVISFTVAKRPSSRPSISKRRILLDMYLLSILSTPVV